MEHPCSCRYKNLFGRLRVHPRVSDARRTHPSRDFSSEGRHFESNWRDAAIASNERMMNSLKGRSIYVSKSNSRRKREFRELERKALIGLIVGAAFVVAVATLALYFGINVHEH